MIEQLAAADFDKQYVYKKYTNKKFLRASTFARDWARTHVTEDGEYIHDRQQELHTDDRPILRRSCLLITASLKSRLFVKGNSLVSRLHHTTNYSFSRLHCSALWLSVHSFYHVLPCSVVVFTTFALNAP
jgi:hypothetical protein